MKLNIAFISRHFAALEMVMLMLCSVAPISAVAGVTDLANGPLASGTGGSTAIRPNIAFIVDDSGSMDSDYMPDGIGGRSSNDDKRCWGWHKYNTVFYNPNFTYKPPFLVGGDVYAADQVTRYPDAVFTDALKDGYFARSGPTYGGDAGTNTGNNLSNLSNLTTPEIACDTAGSSAAVGASATIVFASLVSTKYYASSLTVGATELLNGSSPKIPSASGTDVTDTLGQGIANSVNLGTATHRYTASYNGDNNTLTLTAHADLGNVTATPVLTRVKKNTGSDRAVTYTAFSGYSAAGLSSECSITPTRFYYSTHKTDPNSSTCAANGSYSIVTDASKIEAPGIPVNGISGTGRTGDEIAAAKTNYANWYSYYRRRATLMKAAAGEAFKDLDQSKYRIGLFYINSIQSGAGSQNNDLKIANFTGTTSGSHRKAWYDNLYSARKDSGTPLLGALSRAGRMFAGQIAGYDPVQYSCQQNFAILSTDGYWNTSDSTAGYGAYKLRTATNISEDTYDTVGNQDGPVGAASATIVFQNLSGTSYYVSSLRVNATELLNATEVPQGATTDTAALGSAIVTSVSARSATTGYSATFDSTTNTLTLTAPASAGDLTVTPSLTRVKVGAGTDRTVAISAFSSGAKLPYKDSLNVNNTVSNTLADIAYYYYTNDLRDQAKWGNCSNTITNADGTTTLHSNLCDNNVLGSGKDVNSQQHMTTFTVGLGVSGTIKYEDNYENAPDIANVTQYYDVKNGVASWPNPYNSSAGKIDDLWHAAVNGRGTYYSADNAQSLRDGLKSALSGVQARTGSSAAAATSNLEPVAGDNFVYVALYRTGRWDGDLKAFEINPDTGALSGAALWSAQEELDAQVAASEALQTPGDGRTIKFFSAGEATKLQEFKAEFMSSGQLAYFENICDKTPAIDQCGSDNNDLSLAQKAEANSAENLINYLRGRGQYEDEAVNATAANKLYRGREHVLGDIVNAVPVYVKKPPFSYDTYDTSYATFKTNNSTRSGTVFVAANDGMLHAFNAEKDHADIGKERWAYVPSMVMPNLWKLADRNYGNNHGYFVDGSPTVADICTSLDANNAQMCATAGSWKTIVVGGLNKGGCGYYALDVTDPANPKGLWEFTHANLGYSYGNPIVAKNKAGRWVVIFTSGYNNVPSNGCTTSNGDGNGHVFVVDAATGALLNNSTIPTYTSGTTAAGAVGTPSGLSKLNAWIENAALPVANRLYGGDLLGNVWRIDFDDNHSPGGREAVLLAQLKDGTNANAAQPITIKPELAMATSGGTQYPIVLVGTGKYLGDTDTTDQSRQSIYALKDSLGTSGISNVRGASMVPRTLTQTTGTADGKFSGRTIRTISGDTMTWADKDGWYFDLNPGNTSPGERVNVDMALQFNILTVAANVPEDNACSVGGYAYLYFVDINTGKNLLTSVDGMAGIRLSGNALVAGIKTVKLTSGKTVTIVTDTAGNVSSEDNPDATGGGAGVARRSTWRELPD